MDVEENYFIVKPSNRSGFGYKLRRILDLYECVLQLQGNPNVNSIAPAEQLESLQSQYTYLVGFSVHLLNIERQRYSSLSGVDARLKEFGLVERVTGIFLMGRGIKK